MFYLDLLFNKGLFTKWIQTANFSVIKMKKKSQYLKHKDYDNFQISKGDGLLASLKIGLRLKIQFTSMYCIIVKFIN